MPQVNASIDVYLELFCTNTDMALDQVFNPMINKFLFHLRTVSNNHPLLRTVAYPKISI